MKKNLLAISFSLLLSGAIFGQGVPNNSLENWTNIPFSTAQDPDSWVSFNAFIVQYNLINGANRPMSVTKSSTASVGSFAARIESVNMKDAYPSAVPPGFFPDTAGLLFCGKVDLNTYSIEGFPITAKYSHFVFDYKYDGNGQDSGWASIVLYKGSQQIGLAEFTIKESANYTTKSLPIIYSSALVPDTAMIVFSATNDQSPRMGSVLFIDNTRFDGVVGISGNSNISKIEMFPNPAINQVTVKAPGTEAAFVTLTDITGKVVREGRLQSGQAVIDTADMPASVYFVSILDGQKGLLHTSKLIKN